MEIKNGICFAIAMIVVSFSCFGSGSYHCSDHKKTLKIEGGYSSAGTWITKFSIKKSHFKEGQFEATVYHHNNKFFAHIRDENSNWNILAFETQKSPNQTGRADIWKGLAFIYHDPHPETGVQKRSVEPINCQFFY